MLNLIYQWRPCQRPTVQERGCGTRARRTSHGRRGLNDDGGVWLWEPQWILSAASGPRGRSRRQEVHADGNLAIALSSTSRDAGSAHVRQPRYFDRPEPQGSLDADTCIPDGMAYALRCSEIAPRSH